MNSEDMKQELWKKNVPADMLERISRPHSKATPAIPFTWMVSYTAEGALQNIQMFERGVKHCQLEFPIRVFLSKWTDAIVVTFVPLEAIKEIHIMEWYYTFYEVPVEQAKLQLEEHPKFPYDGRNADLVRADIIVNGGYQKFIDDARKKFKKQGITLPEAGKWHKIYEDDQ